MRNIDNTVSLELEIVYNEREIKAIKECRNTPLTVKRQVIKVCEQEIINLTHILENELYGLAY